MSKKAQDSGESKGKAKVDHSQSPVSSKTPRLNGLYISHEFRGDELLVHVLIDKKIEVELPMARFKAWHRSALKTEEQIEELRRSMDNQVLDVDTLQKRRRVEFECAELAAKYQRQVDQAEFFRQITLRAQAGLSISEFWQGVYTEGRVEKQARDSTPAPSRQGNDVHRDQGQNRKQKKRWTRTRTEFAQFVLDEFKESEEMPIKRRRFLSRKDAVRKLFERYLFPTEWKWTAEKCYQLMYHRK